MKRPWGGDDAGFGSWVRIRMNRCKEATCDEEHFVLDEPSFQAFGIIGYHLVT
jgi:hypothetical protein